MWHLKIASQTGELITYLCHAILSLSSHASQRQTALSLLTELIRSQTRWTWSEFRVQNLRVHSFCCWNCASMCSRVSGPNLTRVNLLLTLWVTFALWRAVSLQCTTRKHIWQIHDKKNSRLLSKACKKKTERTDKINVRFVSCKSGIKMFMDRSWHARSSKWLIKMRLRVIELHQRWLT